MHVGLVHLQDGSELGAEAMRALRGAVQDVAAVAGVVAGNRAARLHGDGGDAVDDEALLDDMRRLGKARIASRLVADRLHEGDVVRGVSVDDGRARLDRVGSQNRGR